MMEALRLLGASDYPLPKLGLEFHFSLPTTKFASFIFGLEYVSANRGKQIMSGIKLVTGQYKDQNGAWQNISSFLTGFDISDDYKYWHHAKLVVDLVNEKYISLVIDDYSFDMEALGYKCYNLGGYPPMWGVIYPYFYAEKDSSDVGAVTCLIDDVIFTSED